jgi:hypothetical protein
MANKRRPRPHTTLDREYLAQDTIRELGQQFGADGPLVFLAIVLEAGKVTSGTPGTVALRFGALASLAFSDREKAREIVAAAHEVGLLADLEEDGERFRARLTKWDTWEAKDRTSAQRSAEYRQRKEEEAA